MADPTKLNGKQIKPGSIIFAELFSSLGLGSLDDGKALVYTHTPTPVVDFQNVKFTKISGVPGSLTPGLAVIINPAGDGIVTSPFVRSFNGGGGDAIFNNTDQMTEGAVNKYFSGKTTDDLPEGSIRKYFSGKTTTDLAEGTNLYWTNARFDTRFGTAFGAKNIQDLNNVDITGIADGDVLKYNLTLTKFEKLTLNASVVPLSPSINDGITTHTLLQPLVAELNNRNRYFGSTLLTLTSVSYSEGGMYIVYDEDAMADAFIISFDQVNGLFFITAFVGVTIFNPSNVPANGKVNVYATGGPGTFQITVDNQTLITKNIRLRKVTS